ncbi:MAG: hypothetical protein ACYCPD_11240 [Acidobacteriaceae bacterium]
MDFITKYKLLVSESSILAAGLSRSQELAALKFDHYDRTELVVQCVPLMLTAAAAMEYK